MSKPREFLFGTCQRWGCEVVCPAEHDGKRTLCSSCGSVVCVTSFSPFGAEEWSGCSEPAVLRACLSELGIQLCTRKRRLAACGIARGVVLVDDYGYRLAIECGETIADDQPPPVSPDEYRTPERFIGEIPASYLIATRCLAPVSEWPLFAGEEDGAPLDVVVDVWRDLLPNPFVPHTWNPDWFTSTVRDIAAHIYNAHEFYSMPILADALQDAGCDDEQILGHCRGDQLHARGCWVLDAILGKT